MFNNLEKKIMAMRPKQLTMKEKNLLWSNIEHGLSSVKSDHAKNGSFNTFNFKKKFVLIPALILALLGGSTITAFAANDTKPGDTLFPVDLAIEKMQIIIAPETKKAELRIKFAKERFEEAKIILATLKENYVTPPSTNSSTSTTATSTETTNQTENTASSTETAENDDKSNIEHEKEAAYNFGTSIGLLEQIKASLENNGDESSVLAVENILEELSKLTESNEVTLDKFKTEIKKGGEKVKVEINVSTDTNNFKLKFEQENDNKKTEINVSEKKSEKRSVHDNKSKEHENNNKDEKKKSISTNKIKVCHNTSGREKGRTIQVSESSLAAHINHGDTVGECDEINDSDKNHGNKNKKHHNDEEDEDDEETGDNDDNDNTATSTPDTTPPEISDISSIATTTSAEITWNTDENSTSTVWYSTSTPLTITENTLKIESAELVLSHSITIPDLTASTTYYYIVGSSDDSENTSVDSELVFLTLQ